MLLIDRINQLNNLWYRERLTATNPSGEIPLPPYGACDLGSFNLTRFVLSPFTAEARIDFKGVEETTRIAERLLDNVIDASRCAQSAQLTYIKVRKRSWRLTFNGTSLELRQGRSAAA